MSTLKTELRVTAPYVSNDMAVWLERGLTLGRLWHACRGRFER